MKHALYLLFSILFAAIGIKHINAGEFSSAFTDAMCVMLNLMCYFYFNLKDEIQKNK
jgi:hypothetical protein